MTVWIVKENIGWAHEEYWVIKKVFASEAAAEAFAETSNKMEVEEHEIAGMELG